jgi:subtilisin family serine protease
MSGFTLPAFVCTVALLAICSICVGQAYAPREVLVKFQAGTPAATVAAADRAASAQLVQTFETIGVRHMRLGPGIDVPGAVNAYQRNPNVLYAEPNYLLHADATPNDASFSALWGMHNEGQTGGTPDADIDAPEAWDLATDAESVIVGVIDTGVDYTHEDLAANMWFNEAELNGVTGQDDDGNGYVDDVFGYNFAYYNPDPMDDYGHGTHCAGTIGAVGDNGVGVVGVNWKVQIMAVKFLDSFGWGTTSGAVASVQYATKMKERGYPIAVLSNSWGGGGSSKALYDAIAAAGAADILFVASAGNNARDADTSPQYPACYNCFNVVSVAASDANDQLASFSNWGAQTVDLAAPGVDVYSTIPANQYALYSGTSMACPHVSGAAALMKAYWGSTAWQVKDQILSSVDQVAPFIGKTVSGGRLNLCRALQASPQTGLPPVAVDDSYGFDKGTPLVVAAPGVLLNDYDPDGDHSQLQAILLDEPVKGTVTLNPDGSFVYTNYPDFSGTDSFTYLADDGTFASAPATVTIVWQTGAIAGTVYNAKGKAVNRATVKAYDPDGRLVAGTTTDTKGRYTLSALPTQLYTVEASSGRLWGQYPGPVLVVANTTKTGINITVR